MIVRQIIPEEVVLYNNSTNEEIKVIAGETWYRSGPTVSWVRIKDVVPKGACEIPVKAKTKKGDTKEVDKLEEEAVEDQGVTKITKGKTGFKVDQLQM